MKYVKSFLFILIVIVLFAPIAWADQITVSQFDEDNSFFNGGYILVDIQLDDIHDLRTYQGEGTFSELVEAAQDQEENEIIVAINGDYWNYMNYERSTVRNGELINKCDYPGRRDYCAIWSSGNMRTYPYTIDPELLEGAWQTFSFGPRLMDDGRAIDDYSDIFDYDLAWHSHPRTAIGYYEPNHYCFLIVFGRTEEDHGCYLEQMAQFFEEIGARDAFNLDGGSSCHIWYKGKEIGKPDEDKPLSDIIYVRKHNDNS